MAAWDTLFDLVCYSSLSVSCRTASLATLLDNSKFHYLNAYIENGVDDEITPFVWDAFRRHVGEEEASLCADKNGVRPIEVEDTDVIYKKVEKLRQLAYNRRFITHIGRCLVRIASGKPEYIDRFGPEFQFVNELNRVGRAFEIFDYELIKTDIFDKKMDLTDFRLKYVVRISESIESRNRLIELVLYSSADDLTRILAISALCNIGATRALRLISVHSDLPEVVRAAAREKSGRTWAVWANRMQLGVGYD